MIDYIEVGSILVQQIAKHNLLRGEIVDQYLQTDESLLYQHALEYKNLSINELMQTEDGTNGSFRQKFALVADSTVHFPLANKRTDKNGVKTKERNWTYIATDNHKKRKSCLRRDTTLSCILILELHA